MIIKKILGLDFDGVICNIEDWAERVGIHSEDLTEGDLADVSPKLLLPIDGALDVLDSGLVKAVITHRKWIDPVADWIFYWLGRHIPVTFPKHNKGYECFRRGIRIFVDDDPKVMEQLREWRIQGILYNRRRHGNLYKFLLNQGVF
jgi:hypothetical protein